MDELFNQFLQTGRVDDYIKYVNSYYNSAGDKKQVEDNAADSQGLNHQGTDYRGE